MLKNFRCYQLSIEFYHLIEPLKLPAHLKNQLLRAASSICLNLSEGSTLRTPKDKRRFYRMSFGSAKECEAILALGRIKNPLILGKVDHLNACLYRLIHSLDQKLE